MTDINTRFNEIKSNLNQSYRLSKITDALESGTVITVEIEKAKIFFLQGELLFYGNEVPAGTSLKEPNNEKLFGFRFLALWLGLNENDRKTLLSRVRGNEMDSIVLVLPHMSSSIIDGLRASLLASDSSSAYSPRMLISLFGDGCEPLMEIYVDKSRGNQISLSMEDIELLTKHDDSKFTNNLNEYIGSGYVVVTLAHEINGADKLLLETLMFPFRVVFLNKRAIYLGNKGVAKRFPLIGRKTQFSVGAITGPGMMNSIPTLINSLYHPGGSTFETKGFEMNYVQPGNEDSFISFRYERNNPGPFKFGTMKFTIADGSNDYMTTEYVIFPASNLKKHLFKIQDAI